MKFTISLLLALVLNSAGFAQNQKPASTTQMATTAAVFNQTTEGDSISSPTCDAKCKPFQTPGSASLGNTVGVLNTAPKKKKSDSPTNTTAETSEVGAEQ